jgi:O-antigen biosynthesis protein
MTLDVIGSAGQARLEFQQDIYQRYGLLAVIVDAFSGSEPTTPVTILDVGSGPARLTEAFLPSTCTIVRADVDQFGDEEVVRLIPGKPLPFADRGLDLVIALDVLEHVPRSERTALLAECQRVAHRGVVLCCPVASPHVTRAEQEFAKLARAVSGQEISFLVEHARFGLPDTKEITDAFEPTAWHVITADNSPLDEWLLFNLIDYVYAADLGDDTAKRTFNASVNQVGMFVRPGAPHYRKFICAFRRSNDAGVVRASLRALAVERPVEASWLAASCAQAIVRLHRDLRAQQAAISAERDSQFAGLRHQMDDFKAALDEKDGYITSLQRYLDEFKSALVEKDAYITGLQRYLDEFKSALDEKDSFINGLQHTADDFKAALDEKDGYITGLQRYLDEFKSALVEKDRRIEELAGRLTELDGTIQVQDAKLASAGQRQAELSQALDVTRRQLGEAQETLAEREAALVGRETEITAFRREVAELRHRSERWFGARLLKVAGQLGGLGRVGWGRGALRSTVKEVWRPLKRWAIGRREYRRVLASTLFDAAWYRQQYVDVTARGMDPLWHYLRYGGFEGRLPHPLFDSSYYLERNPDVAEADLNPLVHYVRWGGHEGRSPHPLFDSSYYLATNPDVAASGMDPLAHYLSSGARERRNPSAAFDSAFYLDQNPDVSEARTNPLVHYIVTGAREGRQPRPGQIPSRSGYVPPTGLLPWFNPLNLVTVPTLSGKPCLNVLLPALALRYMSGGPNTAVALACRLAAQGVRVRFISTDKPLEGDPAEFWEHTRLLAQLPSLPSGLELADAYNRSRGLPIGENDVFLATAWWTAQMAKYAVRQTRRSKFLYLIQDYEPLLHAASTPHALAEETYALDHLPIVNTSLLRDFLVSRKIGRFGEEAFARHALVFEPALDRRLFRPRDTGRPPGRQRLLFYARPTNGLRNLFEMGVAALQKSVADGLFDPSHWEFIGMGEVFSPVPLGPGAVLMPAPWLDLEGYARQMRESDLLLSLMLSPHPSYPPLEMAASGGLAVTTAFANKTAERLASLSTNIIAVEPTIEGIADGLAQAAVRLADGEARRRGAAISLPTDWDASFAPLLPKLLDGLAELHGSPMLPESIPSGASKVFPGYRAWPQHEYDLTRRELAASSRAACRGRREKRFLSFLTPVWNSERAHLEELAESVLGQDGPAEVEWVILDNGSARAETRACLRRIAADPRVHFERVDENLGIIRGTRRCLERAQYRYVATVDHDDLLAPDTVRILSDVLPRMGFPTIAYSDEDYFDGRSFRDPYFKPDWDPVLFANSCYIAHLIVFDRAIALELGAYTDERVEGSHDWDTFVRFWLAGYTPSHVREVLYSWRRHPGSTAANIHVKPVVFESQRQVLEKLLASAKHPERYWLDKSPLFHGTPDWWIRRHQCEPRPITTVLWGEAATAGVSVPKPAEIPHEVVRLGSDARIEDLHTIAERCAIEGSLVHLLSASACIDDDAWPWEVITHFELVPDTVMVGGRIHRNGRIVAAAQYLGFGRGCDCPDRGRTLNDPGYCLWLLKPHSASAVSPVHAVVEPAFLRDALSQLPRQSISFPYLGAWLGAFARERGRRVVYTPFLGASTTVDPDALVGEVERAAFRSMFRHLLPDSLYLPAQLGLSPATAYRPVSALTRYRELDAANEVADYGVWLEADRVARSRYRPGDGRVSVMTGVYAGTPAEILARTAASLFNQSHPFAEWVVVVDGELSPALEATLAQFTPDPRVKVLRQPERRGIIHGLRAALEAASGEYFAPVDHDDLLEPDALAVMLGALIDNQADFAYSDIDILDNEVYRSPFLRPDFDPVLNYESPFIWHLCVFRRDVALQLGAYGDAGAEFCNDWDTVTRFAAAGKHMLHVPHVLYHWRTHADSQSHSGQQNAGTLESARHLLQRLIDAQPNPERYQVKPFPIFRGLQECYVERQPIAPPVVDVLLLGEGPAERDVRRMGLAQCGFPFRHVEATPDDVDQLCHSVDRMLAGEARYLVVLQKGCEPIDRHWAWEAVKLLELHDDIAVVSGRLLDQDGRVLDAGRVWSPIGGLAAPCAGLNRAEPGPYAFALKSHTIVVPGSSLLVIDCDFLRRALQRDRDGALIPLNSWLAAAALAERRRVVYAPLVEARLHRSGTEAVDVDDLVPFRRALDQFGVVLPLRLPLVGMAGFLRFRKKS